MKIEQRELLRLHEFPDPLVDAGRRGDGVGHHHVLEGGERMEQQRAIWVLESMGDKVAVTSEDYIVPSIKITYSGFSALHIELVTEKYDLRQYNVSWIPLNPNDGTPGERVTDHSSWRLFGLYDEPTHY